MDGSFVPHQEKVFPYLTSSAEDVSNKSFDYIIVGGGTAGCPLAVTLAEKFSVLVVERGGSPYQHPLIMYQKSTGLALLEDEDSSSVRQSFVSEDGVPNLRGRVLGGSSVINGGFYSRASGDFVRKVGWDPAEVERSYEWVEERIVFEPELTGWQSVVRESFLEGGMLPESGFRVEHVVGTKIGATIFDANGKRHSSADLLMEGNPNSRNVTVLLNATVKNVMFRSSTTSDSDGKDEKIAYGIRYIKSDDTSEQTFEAYLSRSQTKSSPYGDIILCAGALGSPQILLLSGIGPFEHLRCFDLPLVLDLQGVGLGMKDNPMLSVSLVSEADKYEPDNPQVVGVGVGSRIVIEAGIGHVSHDTMLVLIAARLAFPLSQGKLELKSSDPRQNPSVRFNYLGDEEDMRECREGLVGLLRRIAGSSRISGFLGGEGMDGDPLMRVSDGELSEFCKRKVRTFYHYHGGCVVGSVVDEDYKVFGVKGLRVVDGSTLFESPGTNPMATLLMLGRYQGIKILNETAD